MPITDITKNVEEQVLGALSMAQEAVVDGIKSLAEAVEPVIPDVPRPFATEAAELVDGAFTFAEKLLHNSHEFVGRLFDAADTTSDTKAPATSTSTSTSTSAKPAAATKAGAK
jgi:hypothetical protein